MAQGLSLLTKLTDLIGLTIKKKIAVIEQSGCFDSDWYLGNYSDVAEKAWNPVEHYLRFGSKEKRNPSPAFDTAWYLERYPDVAKSGMNPLLHYIRMGRSEGRQPSGNQQSGADISCVGQAMQKLASHLDEQAREIEKLARSRDEQWVLSAERQSRIETLTQAHAALETEKQVLSEQRGELEQALAAQTQALAEARAEAQQRQTGIEQLERERSELEQQLFAGQTQIETLIQVREEQAVLVAERQSRIETLTQAHAAQEAEKRALSEQRNRLEGVLAAITQEQNERQQHIEKESELAERQFAEIKQWLLSEAHV